jgi:5-(carboxyamino)imidazole ribonucleotide mutase
MPAAKSPAKKPTATPRQARGPKLSPKKTVKSSRAAKPSRKPSKPLVGVIMGSKSDWETMKEAVAALKEMGVPCEAKVVSAHRTPKLMNDYAAAAAKRGLEVIIAGAGGAAHLPGMTASMTSLPVIGVPVNSKQLKGLDSLLSIVQMPAGVPVATVSIGNARNAGLLATRILGVKYPAYRKAVEGFMKKQERDVLAQPALGGDEG